MTSSLPDTSEFSFAAPQRRRPVVENKRILLVDDEPDVLEALRQLAGDEFDVHVATCGEEALALSRKHGPFAVVACDHQLGQETGPAVMRELALRWPETLRLLVTGHLDAEVTLRALDEGEVYRILRKPVDGATFRKALRAGVEKHRAVRTERFLCEQLQFTRETLLSFTNLLEERVEEQMDVLGRIHQLSVRLNEVHSLEEIARLVVHAASRALGDRGVRLVLHEGGKRARHVEVETGAWSSQDAHEEPVVTADGELGRMFVEPYGPQGRALAKVDKQVLASLASTTAVAAHNEIRRRERDEAQHATIFALARLAEHRDNETGKHLERVSLYCRLIAQGLRADGHYVDQITDGFIDDLVRSAPLHDIGKVGIPDRILLKPGKLDPDEWEVMKTHAEIGAETLRSVAEQTERASGFLEMGLEIAWCHHEKWNGEGYPRGLVGQEIPLSARILTLADVYDALTTKRPYKEPWPHQEAVDFIASRAELDYDPAVVNAFLSRLEEADEIRERLKDTEDDFDPEAVAAA